MEAFEIKDGVGIIPPGTTEIGRDAFSECGEFTSIVIPDSVIKIDAAAFWSCDNLRSIKVSPGNKVYDSREGCNAIIETASNCLIVGCATSKIPEGVTRIGYGAFGVGVDLENIVIPASVRVIDDSAFYGCWAESYELPPSVEVIGESAFNRCCVKSVVIPSSVKVIGDYAFNECDKLETVEILSPEVKIGKYAFDYCEALKTVKMPNIIEYNGWFRDCPKLTNVEMPSAEVIGYGAFRGQTKLKKMVFPRLLEVGIEAFKGCTGLKSISMPRVVEIKANAFEDCTKLKDIEMPAVEEFGSEAFAGCTALESIELPSLEVVGRDAFMYCTALKSAKISSDAHSPDIYELLDPFEGCNNLTSLELLPSGHARFYDLDTFHDLDLEEIIVPAGTGKHYRERTTFRRDIIVERDPEK